MQASATAEGNDVAQILSGNTDFCLSLLLACQSRMSIHEIMLEKYTLFDFLKNITVLKGNDEDSTKNLLN